MELNKYLSMETILESSNLAEEMDYDDVCKVGEMVRANYQTDKQSRAEWEDRYAEGMKLAMQLIEEKTTPWTGASNAKFPLLTIAALQYHARAYPALVRGTQPVSCRVVGEDPTGQKQARAKRVSAHMSFQVMEEDQAWEEQHDRALIVQSFVGSAFKKVYYDSGKRHNVSELVLPKDLVMNYWTKSIETCERMTHVIGLSVNDIEERRRRGLFLKAGHAKNIYRDPNDASSQSASTQQANPRGNVITEAEDDISGTRPPAVDEDTPVVILEQHMYLDLDGDGYREPYIAFVRDDTGEMLRLVARFEPDRVERDEDDQILKIVPEQYFVKIPFIPSPDGSVYDMGFFMLLGATNAVIDTCINQLMDAGTMSNLGGGFFARGIRIKGGELSFRPGEWKRTDSNAADMKNGIVPLPVREPSNVLFQLLGLMIDVGRQIGMATDAASGENPGQNQKVGTTEAVIEQGEKVFNGIYKRTFRALRNEFRLMYRLNYLRRPLSGKFEYASDGQGPGGVALWQDYLETDRSVVPAADPSLSSKEKITQRDMVVNQLANSVPGFNRYEVVKRLLENMEVPGIDQIYPKPGTPGAAPPPTPPQVQIAQIKAQMQDKKEEHANRRHQLELMQEARLNQSKIMKLEAETALILQEVDQGKNKEFLEMHKMEMEAAKQYQEQLNGAIEGYSKILQMNQSQGEQGDNKGKMGSMAQPGGNDSPQGLPQGGAGGGQGVMG